jgi:hypothetical protein
MLSIKQLRKIVQQELRRPLRESQNDFTIDVITEFVADYLKTELFDTEEKVSQEFLNSPLVSSISIPSDQQMKQRLVNLIAQQVLTRIGKDLQIYVNQIVSNILDKNNAMREAREERFEIEPEPQGMFIAKIEQLPLSEDLPDDYEKCNACGFDHEYDWSKAVAWHDKNDFEDIC